MKYNFAVKIDCTEREGEIENIIHNNFRSYV